MLFGHRAWFVNTFVYLLASRYLDRCARSRSEGVEVGWPQLGRQDHKVAILLFIFWCYKSILDCWEASTGMCFEVIVWGW